MAKQRRFSPQISAAKHFAFLAKISPRERSAAHRRYVKGLKQREAAEKREILRVFRKMKNERLMLVERVERVVQKTQRKFPNFDGIYFFGSFTTKAKRIPDIDVLPIISMKGKPAILFCSSKLRSSLFSAIERATGIKAHGLEMQYSTPRGMKPGLVAINSAAGLEQIKKGLGTIKKMSFAVERLRFNPYSITAKPNIEQLFRKAILEILSSRGK